MIKLENVSFSFGDRVIFDNVTISLHKNEFSAIIGHNGSGKTTLIKLLMGFLKQHSGKISINGTDIRSKEFRRMNRAIGYISQGAIATNLPITVKEVIQIAGTGSSGFDRQHYEQILDSFGLKTIEHDLYRTLSGGQKQRVNIARCIAQQSEIIILDEPDSFLDPHACREIMDLIKELNIAKKVSIIMISHDFALIEKYSDRLFVIENRSITETDFSSLCLPPAKMHGAFHG